jgi:hypothetical protein
VLGAALTVRDRRGVGFEGSLILVIHGTGLVVSTTVA